MQSKKEKKGKTFHVKIWRVRMESILRLKRGTGEQHLLFSTSMATMEGHDDTFQIQ